MSSHCRRDARHRGGAKPSAIGGLYRQTDEGVQDWQQTGSQQTEPEPP